MKRESRPHGEPAFTYHPHKIEDPETFADNYDRIFKKGKYAVPTQPEFTFVCCLNDRQRMMFARAHKLHIGSVVRVRWVEDILGFKGQHTIYLLPEWYHGCEPAFRIEEIIHRGWTATYVTEKQLCEGTALTTQNP